MCWASARWTSALTAGLVVSCFSVILLLYKELLVVSFDPVLAATLRLPAEALRIVILVLLALTIVVSLQSVGVGLVSAMLVTPGATASLLTRRLPRMMAVAAALGAASSIIGLYASYYLNVVSGAAIVLTATVSSSSRSCSRRGTGWCGNGSRRSGSREARRGDPG